jgi:hypothetical protein
VDVLRQAPVVTCSDGRKVFTLQTLSACDDSCDDRVGKLAGYFLLAGVAVQADPVVIHTILDHLKTKEKISEPFPLPESRAPPGELFG